MNIPQAGLCVKKLLLVENRNHVWRGLVDIECKVMVYGFTLKHFQEICDVNMPQSGLCDMMFCVENRNHVLRDLSW